jgi:hypothetical protein
MASKPENGAITMSYATSEAKRIGLQRTIDASQKGSFSVALINSAARKLRAENIRRLALATRNRTDV